MKVDPYKHKERWLKWKEENPSRINGLSEINSKLVLQYLNDMELGINTSISSKKGARSYARMNTIKNRLIFLSKRFENYFDTDDVSGLNERQICEFFSKMRSGEIRRDDGKIYLSVADYVKNFKAFWHWYQKSSKKEGIEVEDITTYLDTSKSKPKWVYLTEEQVKQLYEHSKPNYKVLIMFLFDAGIRAPTEMSNIKVSDFYNDCKEVNIRDEISKTFGRRIKLMLCSELIKKYIEENQLSDEDYLFKITPPCINKYLKRLSRKLFGEEKSPGGEKYSELTMYDFRHCSCCYWLPRYKSESALKFRFGWKKSDKIHYYSELLGMRDTINEEDMLIDVTKTELENQIKILQNEKEMQNERLKFIEDQNKKILLYLDRLEIKIPQIVV